MASNDKQLTILIGREPVYVAQVQEAPVAISYLLEDKDDFQSKSSAQAFDVTVPATLSNSKVANSFESPNVEDTSAGEWYRNPRPCSIIAGGINIFEGQALLQSGSRTDRPEDYVWHMLGANGDWLVQMQEKTLWDCLSGINHTFNAATVEASWAFNGTNESQDYVYALAKYKRAFDSAGTVVTMYHMRPALFIWPMIVRAFRAIGYRVASAFMDTDYFRRCALPWVWGNFLKIDSKQLDVLKFKGRIRTGYSRSIIGVGSSQTVNEYCDDNGLVWDNETTLGAFDNATNFSWDGHRAKFTYQAQYFNQFGALIVGFHVRLVLNMSVGWNSNASFYVEMYVDTGSGPVLSQSQLAKNVTAGATGTTSFSASPVDLYFASPGLGSGHSVSFRIKCTGFKTNLGQLTAEVYGDSAAGGIYESFVENTYFKKPLGGLVDLKIYDKFKSYGFLDLLRGLCDTFDLVPQTDSVSKVVYFEPAYPYILNDGTGVVTQGYFRPERLDWNAKVDRSQKAVLTSYADTEREQVFRFKDDANDGGVTKYNSRFSLIAGSAKYLFPARFKTGKREVQNRFFAPVVHYLATAMKPITGVAPQLIVLVPENISNTSADEAESQLAPKLAWYKGLCARATYGGWTWKPDPDSGSPDSTRDLPYMFAVNYKAGGQNDPVLAYNDQNIDGQLGRGLLRRFFLPRLAVMTYGKRYEPWLRLNNNDVTNWLHREALIMDGADYYLTAIDGYKPLLPISVKCTFWKYKPVTQDNVDACFPSTTSVITGPATLPADDILYQPLLLLSTDIP